MITGPLLPANGVLLHIGPPHTGATPLQAAYDASRTALHAQDVASVPGKLQRLAAGSVIQRPAASREVGTPAHNRIWEQLCMQVARMSDQRVLVASENFGDANDATIPRVVAGLGGDRVHVVITVRSLEKLLPATWLHGVRHGATSTYGRWLRQVLKGPQEERLTMSASRFWSRHDHARLVERWAAVAGKEQVAVLVVDERRPEVTLRDAETLIGVPPGTLHPGPSRGRTLTAEEAELIRQVNVRINDDPERRRSQRWITRGAVTNLLDARRPPPDESPVATPADAVLRAREIGRVITARLVATGVRILGDPSALVPDTPVAEQSIALPTKVDDDVAVELLVGMIRAAEADARPVERMDQLSTRDLLAEVRARAARKVRRQPDEDIVLAPRGDA